MTRTSVTTKVYLMKRSRTLPSGKRAATWYLKWSGFGGRQLTESLGRASRMTKAQAKKLRQRPLQPAAAQNHACVPLAESNSGTRDPAIWAVAVGLVAIAVSQEQWA